MSLVEIIKQVLKYIEEHLTLITAGLSILSLVLITFRIDIEKRILSKFGLQEFYKKATITELLSDYGKGILCGLALAVLAIISYKIIEKTGEEVFAILILKISIIILIILTLDIIFREKFKKKNKNKLNIFNEGKRDKLESCGADDIDCQIEKNIASCNSKTLYILFLLFLLAGFIYFFIYEIRIGADYGEQTKSLISIGTLITLIIKLAIYINRTIKMPHYEVTFFGVSDFSSGTYKEIEQDGKKYAIVYMNDDNFCCLRCETADDELTLLVNENYITNIAGCEFTRKEYTTLNILQ